MEDMNLEAPRIDSANCRKHIGEPAMPRQARCRPAGRPGTDRQLADGQPDVGQPDVGQLDDNGQLVVKITILPTNVALVAPPTPSPLPPLDSLAQFRFSDSDLGPDRLIADLPHSGEHMHLYPAGLVSRIERTLLAAGYEVTVIDRRSERSLCVREDLSTVTDDRFCLSVIENPLAQIVFNSWMDPLRQIATICWLFPTARILIFAPNNYTAIMLASELKFFMKLRVSIYSDRHVSHGERLTVATSYWLRRLNPVGWDILIPAFYDRGGITLAICRQVLRMRALRVYALRGNIRFRSATLLRLEAMAGRLLEDCS